MTVVTAVTQTGGRNGAMSMPGKKPFCKQLLENISSHCSPSFVAEFKRILFFPSDSLSVARLCPPMSAMH